jgi:hypothetical protein
MNTGVLRRYLAAILAGLLVGLPSGPPVHAQAPTADPPVQPRPPQELEELVGRVALYPDDLLAIILPASTFPLDIVQADRFLQKVKQDKNLKPDQRWDESIRNLLNYPEVISMMSQDLEWTQDLGEAVVSQQADVLKAVQAFRAKAVKAGNLKTDDKQIIIQEKEVIKIVPADPEVIYVPQYQPTTVVVQQTAPAYGYYPAPYPSYYYPYPPGYAFAGFATGFFLGAATAYACNWGGGDIQNNVNINNTQNMSMNRNNQQIQQKKNEARQRADQARSQRGGQAGQGGRGPDGGQRWQSQKRPGDVSGGRVSPRTAQARPGYGGSGASRGDAFGGGGRGSDAMRDSNRGMQSRGESAFSGGRGGGARGASASTMDRGGSRGGGGASMGGSSRSSGASRGGGGFSGGGGSRGGGGGGRGGGGGGRRR